MGSLRVDFLGAPALDFWLKQDEFVRDNKGTMEFLLFLGYAFVGIEFPASLMTFNLI